MHFRRARFKLSSRLTLNLGIRYEYDQPWYEQNNKTANVLPSGVVEYAGQVPAGAIRGAVVCPNRACYDANFKQIMPRLGFAYQAMNKLVIRGGYGIYYGRLINSTIYNALVNTGVNGGQFSFRFNATSAGAPAFPQIITTQPNVSGALAIVYLDPHLQNPAVHQTDLTIERDLG